MKKKKAVEWQNIKLVHNINLFNKRYNSDYDDYDNNYKYHKITKNKNK